jgi:hypothetical protein
LLTPRVARALRARVAPRAGAVTWTRAFDSRACGLASLRRVVERCAGVGRALVLVQPEAADEDEAEDEDEDEAYYVAHVSPGFQAKPRHDFHGDDACKTFRVDGKRGVVVDTSGVSVAPLYCAYGYSRHGDVVNGFGMFGKIGRHALFVDAALENAHADFGARRFSVRRVEVWALEARAPGIDAGASPRAATRDRATMAQFTSSAIARDVLDATTG